MPPHTSLRPIPAHQLTGRLGAEQVLQLQPHVSRRELQDHAGREPQASPPQQPDCGEREIVQLRGGPEGVASACGRGRDAANGASEQRFELASS